MKNGRIDQPVFVMAFCGGQVDHDEYFHWLQKLVGNKVPIIGGSAIGIITNEHLSYDGFPAGAAIIESDTLQHIEGYANNLHKNAKENTLLIIWDMRYVLLSYFISAPPCVRRQQIVPYSHL